MEFFEEDEEQKWILTAKKEFVALKSNWKCIERTNKVRINNGLGKNLKSVQDSLECQYSF